MSNPVIALTCPQCGAGLPDFNESTFCAYCGTALLRAQNNSPSEPVVTGYRLRWYSCIDAQTGLEAFRLLMPAGWAAQGGVFWQNNNPGSPAKIYFQIANPLGGYSFTIFPHLSFFWTNDMMARMTFPAGSLYLGNEVRQPLPALAAIKELFLPRFRPIPGMQVVTEQQLTELPRQISELNPYRTPGNLQHGSGKLLLRYAENGQPVEEEIYGITEYNSQAAPGMWGANSITYWTLDYMIGLKAPQGRLAGMGELYQALMSSFRLNQEWYTRLGQISQYLIQNQIQQINNIGQISRYVSQVNNQISDTITRGYYNRQYTLDRLNTQFSQSIRGVEGYFDPNKGYEVELPGGYSHAWANPLGEYVLSDNASFNPNVGSNLSWTELGRA